MWFTVCDTLSGRILGELEPSSWEFGDPLRSSGTGSMTVAVSPEAAQKVWEMTRPRRRWVAVRDDQSRFLWAGPIIREPGYSDGALTVPLVDWRSWFASAQVKPHPTTGARRNYKVTNRDQALIMTDLMALALEGSGMPRFVVDSAPSTGVNRDLTATMLDRPVGGHLDTIRARGGPDWWCYPTQESATSLLMHIAVAWPERRTRDSRPLIEWRLGEGGNTHEPSWPEGRTAFTRVWALGDGEPPAQVFTSEQWSEVDRGEEPVWETVIGPLTDVKDRKTVFQHAWQETERQRGHDGTAEFSIAHERLPLGDLGTGDRVRVVFGNGWVTAETPASRIVDSTISGGRGKPTIRRVSIDLSDNTYGANPGEEVADE